MVWNLLASMPKQHLFMPKTMGAVICNGCFDICGGTNSFLVVYIGCWQLFLWLYIVLYIYCVDVYSMHFVWSEAIPTIYIHRFFFFFLLLWEEKFDWIRGRYVWREYFPYSVYNYSKTRFREIISHNQFINFRSRSTL